MSKTILTSVTILFLLSIVFLTGLFFNIQPVNASGTIYIRTDGSVDPSIANITSVDNITYYFTDNNYESIVIERDDILIDGGGYSLRGTGSSTGIRLSGITNVTIKDVEIRGFQDGIAFYGSSNNYLTRSIITKNIENGIAFYGLPRSSNNNNISLNEIADNGVRGISLAHNCSHNTICRNHITGQNYGVLLLSDSNYNDVSDNNITGNEDGLFISYCSNNTVTSNDVLENNSSGIWLYSSSQNLLRNNRMVGNKYNFDLDGSEGLPDFINDIDTSNTVNGKPIICLMNQQDLIIDAQTSPAVGYLAITNSTNVHVQHLNMKNNGQGILLAYTNYSSIHNMTLNSNGVGIQLSHSFHNDIYGNNFADNERGADLRESSNNFIHDNNVTNNSHGMYLGESSKDNKICANNITNTHRGIQLSYSSNNEIAKNEITGHDFWGIRFENSNNNSIVENSITGNGKGIILQWSSYNSFLYNHFIDNPQQVDMWTSHNPNLWNNFVEGNYWSDYGGTDSDHNGIGSTPYIIDGDNIDNYPLMGMFSSFNTSLGYDVNVISNSTIEHFQHFESNRTIKMCVSNITTDQTFGFCRVSISKSLITPDYVVVIKFNGTPMDVLHFNHTIHDNSTHRWIYFAYEHSTLEITILPELSSLLILAVFIIATTVSIIFYRRKITNQKKGSLRD